MKYWPILRAFKKKYYVSMLSIGAIAGVFYFFKGPLYFLNLIQWPDSEIEFTQTGTEETTKSAPASLSTPENKIQNTELKQLNLQMQSVLNNAFLHYQTGDYEGAVKLLRLEFKTHPENLELQKNLGAALYSLALMRIQMHNYVDAEILLDEATKIGFTDAQQLLAKVKLKQGNTDSAASILQEVYEIARKNNQNEPALAQALVDLALRDDDTDRANLFLNQMESDVSADRSFISERRAQLESKSAFLRLRDTVQRQNTEVSYVGTEHAAMAESVADAIEKILTELSSLMGPLPAASRLKAWLLPSEKFQIATGAPPWAGALFDGIIRLPAPEGKPSSGLLSTIIRMARHESTHAYMSHFCGNLVPSWMGEGLAQHYEGKSPSQSYVYLQQTYGRNKEWSADPSILDSNFVEAPADQIKSLYARSFLLTEIISKEEGNESFWKTLLGQACLTRVSITEVLDNLTGASTAAGLWQKYTAALQNAYAQK